MGDEQRNFGRQSIDKREEDPEAPPTGEKSDRSDKTGDKLKAAGFGVAAGAAAVGLGVEALTGSEADLASAERDSAGSDAIVGEPSVDQLRQAAVRDPLTSEPAARTAVAARSVAQPLDPIVVTAGTTTAGETTLIRDQVRVGAPPGFDTDVDDADMTDPPGRGSIPDDTPPVTPTPGADPNETDTAPPADEQVPGNESNTGTSPGDVDDNIYVIDEEVIDLDAISGGNVVYGQSVPDVVPNEPVPDVEPSNDANAQDAMETEQEDEPSHANEGLAEDA